jgi:hypothetical protein
MARQHYVWLGMACVRARALVTATAMAMAFVRALRVGVSVVLDTEGAFALFQIIAAEWWLRHTAVWVIVPVTAGWHTGSRAVWLAWRDTAWRVVLSIRRAALGQCQALWCASRPTAQDCRRRPTAVSAAALRTALWRMVSIAACRAMQGTLHRVGVLWRAHMV